MRRNHVREVSRVPGGGARGREWFAPRSSARCTCAACCDAPCRTETSGRTRLPFWPRCSTRPAVRTSVAAQTTCTSASRRRRVPPLRDRAAHALGLLCVWQRVSDDARACGSPAGRSSGGSFPSTCTRRWRRRTGRAWSFRHTHRSSTARASPMSRACLWTRCASGPSLARPTTLSRFVTARRRRVFGAGTRAHQARCRRTNRAHARARVALLRSRAGQQTFDTVMPETLLMCVNARGIVLLDPSTRVRIARSAQQVHAAARRLSLPAVGGGCVPRRAGGGDRARAHAGGSACHSFLESRSRLATWPRGCTGPGTFR